MGKIISIICYHNMLVAVCDDGSLWACDGDLFSSDLTWTLKSPAKKLQENAVKLYESLHCPLRTRTLRQDDLEKIEASLQQTREEALEEAAAIAYGNYDVHETCVKSGETIFDAIRALKTPPRAESEGDKV